MRGQDFGNPYSVTFAGSVSAIATQAGTTDRLYFVTDVSGSADKAAKLEVRDGTTVLWQDQIVVNGTSASVFAYSFSTPLRGTAGNAISVYVGSATTVSYANLSGYFLP